MSWMAARWDQLPANASDEALALQRRTVDLLEADQVLIDKQITFYRRGTDVVLMRKNVDGTTCADNVSLTQ